MSGGKCGAECGLSFGGRTRRGRSVGVSSWLAGERSRVLSTHGDTAGNQQPSSSCVRLVLRRRLRLWPCRGGGRGGSVGASSVYRGWVGRFVRLWGGEGRFVRRTSPFARVTHLPAAGISRISAGGSTVRISSRPSDRSVVTRSTTYRYVCIFFCWLCELLRISQARRLFKYSSRNCIGISMNGEKTYIDGFVRT